MTNQEFSKFSEKAMQLCQDTLDIMAIEYAIGGYSGQSESIFCRLRGKVNLWGLTKISQMEEAKWK